MDNVIRGGNWYFEQFNLWRVLDEVTIPKLSFGGDDFAPGGHMMAAKFPENLEALEAEIKTRTADPQIRAMCGRQPGDWISATYYENLMSFRTGQSKGRIIMLKGLINEVTQDATKGLKSAGVQYTFGSIILYRDIVDARDIHRFDFFGGPGATIVDGRAVFAEMASNLSVNGGVQL